MNPAQSPHSHSNDSLALPEVLDTKAAATLLQVHLTTVQQLAQRGEIPCCRVGKEYRFLREALSEWLRGELLLSPRRRRR